jgi:four helix bundle protein
VPLDHANLHVYHCALDLLDIVDQLVSELPAGRAHLKDQLDRAATSIVLNIAEGAGEFSGAEKQRFYRMAKRSATETSAIIDILARRGQLAPEGAEAIGELIARVVAMLTTMTMK